MTYDMNDAELPRGSDLIPDGSFMKVTMAIRPGGCDGQGEADRGLLKRSQTPGSDVMQIDAEFTVAAGPHARRKFWQQFTVTGGKVDENGVSIGWKISKGQFRAMIVPWASIRTTCPRPPVPSACCVAWPTSPASPSPPRFGSSQQTIHGTAPTTGWTGSCCRGSRNTAASWMVRPFPRNPAPVPLKPPRRPLPLPLPPGLRRPGRVLPPPRPRHR